MATSEVVGHLGTSRFPLRTRAQGRVWSALVIAVRREKHPQETPVVERIFLMRASGMSCLEIVKTLNEERFPHPCKGRVRGSVSGTSAPLSASCGILSTVGTTSGIAGKAYGTP